MSSGLRLALIGYGRMGRSVEQVAERSGHRVVSRIFRGAAEPEQRQVTSRSLDGCDLAIEFSAGDRAEALVRAALELDLPTVSGSTGWEVGVSQLRQQHPPSGAGFLHAPNFSLGLAVMRRLSRSAAELLGARLGFAPFIVEEHHQAKRDAPSGTAKLLAEDLIASIPGKARYGVPPADGPVPPELIPVAWVRAGSIPGTHCVGFDGSSETIELVHRVRQREVFAEGAVRAAEWLSTQRGPQRLESMIEAWLHVGHD